MTKESRDFHREMRESAAQRKDDNAARAIALLQERGVVYELKTGSHVVIQERWDFWPTTGRWKDRTTHQQGNGVQALLQAVANPGTRASRKVSERQPPRALVNLQVPFESKNGGEHLIVCNRWDFWPRTGLAIERGTGKRTTDVNQLVQVIRKWLKLDVKPSAPGTSAQASPRR